MSELQPAIESAYETAKSGDWERLLADWSRVPAIARRCSRYAKPGSSWTFLHQAAYFGHANACRLLVEMGADLEATTHDGLTAADVARSKGHSELADQLRAASIGRDTLWSAPVDPDVRPSSNRWSEAKAMTAAEELLVAYGGGLVRIPARSTYYTDAMGRTLVGWHGTIDPPSGMDGESLLKL